MKWANIDANTFGTHSDTTGNSVVSLNWGDHVQIFAIEHLYRYMGIPASSIIKLSYYDLQTYSGEPVVLPINLVVNLLPLPSGALFSENIYPVFLGACFPYGVTKETARWLKKWEPIGCRDEGSYRLLQDLGVDSYLAGCLTITLPKRSKAPTEQKIFIIDAPQDVTSMLPHTLSSHAIIRSNVYHGRLDDLRCAPIEYAKTIYKQLADEATLVITSRLHVTSPCLAMGVPVYCCVSKVTAAFTWLQRFVKVYTCEELQKLDWSTPHESNISEDIKGKILMLAKERLLSTYYKFSSIHMQRYLSEQYLQSSHNDYIFLPFVVKNIICEIAQTYRRDIRFRYTLWGAVPQACIVYDEIQNQFSEAELVGVYDTYKTGVFLDKQIQHPENIAMCDDNTFHIVCAEGALCAAEKLFGSLNIVSTRFLLLADKIREICFSERKLSSDE